MTPRVVMHQINEQTTLDDYYKNNDNLRFSRIPVYSDKGDNISGIVLKYDILKSIIDGQGGVTLSSIKRQVKLVSENTNLRMLFDLFTESNEHLAVVTDSYGSITGIVTMEDLMETILGLEIVDETDGVTDMQALAQKIRAERDKKLGLK